MAKKNVQGTTLVAKPTHKAPPSDLARIVQYTVEYNEEGVEEFLENANSPIGATTDEMVQYAMLVIGIGKQEKLTEFLDLHPDREVFAPDGEQDKSSQKLLDKHRRRHARTIILLPKLWVLLVVAFGCFLLFGGLLYWFTKQD